MRKTPKILITGGLGFIFSYVTEYFVNKGWAVVVLDNESSGSHPEIINGSFKYYKINVSSPEVIDLIIEENPEYIIHAAAISDVDFSIKYSYETMVDNILGNINIFEACKQIPNFKKLIYISTDEVYGECEHPKKETEIIFPKNPYSCSKATGSLMRLAYDNSFKELRDKTAETRFCNVFGHRQDRRKIMPAIKDSLNGEYSIPLHNKGKGYREYIYVKNIPPVIDLILEKGDRTYNVTLNDGYTVEEIIEIAEKVTGKKCSTHPSHREGMDSKYQMDGTRLKEELGWKPLYSFEEGLKEYLCQEKK
ncbi:GDP-mannose 4,6-dehydratase [Candidatus Gracilibacteria bacterium]|nr:GDP-mannose 4,6-dehydratase [Candidatus Gracilibacteria bacterium]